MRINAERPAGLYDEQMRETMLGIGKQIFGNSAKELDTPVVQRVVQVGKSEFSLLARLAPMANIPAKERPFTISLYEAEPLIDNPADLAVFLPGAQRVLEPARLTKVKKLEVNWGYTARTHATGIERHLMYCASGPTGTLFGCNFSEVDDKAMPFHGRVPDSPLPALAANLLNEVEEELDLTRFNRILEGLGHGALQLAA